MYNLQEDNPKTLNKVDNIDITDLQLCINAFLNTFLYCIYLPLLSQESIKVYSPIFIDCLRRQCPHLPDARFPLILTWCFILKKRSCFFPYFNRTILTLFQAVISAKQFSRFFKTSNDISCAIKINKLGYRLYTSDRAKYVSYVLH